MHSYVWVQAIAVIGNCKKKAGNVGHSPDSYTADLLKLANNKCLLVCSICQKRWRAMSSRLDMRLCKRLWIGDSVLMNKGKSHLYIIAKTET